MKRAFIFENDTILCRQTPEGWRPLSVVVSVAHGDAVNDNITRDSISHDGITAIEQPRYQLGYVELFESLAPQHWQTNKAHSSKSDVSNGLDTDATAIGAMSHHYAQSNNMALPVLNEHTAFMAYRQLITHLPAALAAQISQALQLLRWQADTRFCSRCSAPVTTANFGERAMVCAVCQLRQYPRVQPCIITAITRPNPQTGEMQILLAHHHRYGQQNRPLQYGLIAGFVEVGESLEHAVVREVAEEVGITLTDIRYVSSQPWPFPSNLMLGFRACHASGDIVIQEEELSHAEFFDISNLPKIPSKGSIAYELIAQIMQEQGKSLS